MNRTIINQRARKLIAEQCEEENLTRCEAQIYKICMGEAHAPAHRHKRVWYYKPGRTELLHDKKQWIAACQKCHHEMEYNKGLTELIFERTRGPEK